MTQPRNLASRGRQGIWNHLGGVLVLNGLSSHTDTGRLLFDT